jgi:uncharacterized protein YbdZ (MbtH family)
MTWDVIQNAQGDLQLIEHGAAVTEGWAVVAETANPDYLEYMANLPQE